MFEVSILLVGICSTCVFYEMIGLPMFSELGISLVCWNRGWSRVSKNNYARVVAVRSDEQEGCGDQK